ncbi:MAG: cbb3-type cytochrome oxidase assembly protein CcoS [Planctomycetota bacterium]
MSILYIMIPVAFLLAGSALAAFFWSVHKGQFDDLDTPALRPLIDDTE